EEDAALQPLLDLTGDLRLGQRHLGPDQGRVLLGGVADQAAETGRGMRVDLGQRNRGDCAASCAVAVTALCDTHVVDPLPVPILLGLTVLVLAHPRRAVLRGHAHAATVAPNRSMMRPWRSPGPRPWPIRRIRGSSPAPVPPPAG